MQSIRDFFEDSTVWNTIFFFIGTLFFIGLTSEESPASLLPLSALISTATGFLSSLFNFKRAILAFVLFIIGHAGGAFIMTIFKYMEGDSEEVSQLLQVLKTTVPVSLMTALVAGSIWFITLPTSYFLFKKFLSK